MVLKLKLSTPAKFYGSSLPRPRFYADVKFNDERVDPPLPVLDPLLTWANEAHWSMGGLSFKRLRLQGRIEGNVGKLRAERQKTEDKKQISKRASSDSPPPAPVANKRRRFLALLDEGEDDEEDLEEVRGKRLVKKLAVEFDRVAAEAVASRTRSRKLEVVDKIEAVMQVVKNVSKLSLKGKKQKKRKVEGHRTSPRLAKRT